MFVEYRFLLVWQLVGVALAAVLVASSLMPNLPDAPIVINDKLLHFFAYCVLGGWLASLLFRGYWPFLYIALCLLGLSLELAQYLGGHRQGDAYDMLANALGAMAGIWLLGQWVVIPILKWIDSALSRTLLK